MGHIPVAGLIHKSKILAGDRYKLNVIRRFVIDNARGSLKWSKFRKPDQKPTINFASVLAIQTDAVVIHPNPLPSLISPKMRAHETDLRFTDG